MTTRKILQSWTPASWRDDAYDPARDAPDTRPARKRQIELVPGVWVYPEFFETQHGDLYAGLDDYV